MPSFVPPRPDVSCLRRRLAWAAALVGLVTVAAAVGAAWVASLAASAANWSWIAAIAVAGGVLAAALAGSALQPLWRGLARLETALTGPAAAPPTLPATGVQELDRALSPLQRWLQAFQSDAASWREHLERLAAGQRPVGAAPQAGLGGVGSTLDHSLSQLVGLLEGWRHYVRRVYAEGAEPAAVLAELPPAWRQHVLVDETVGVLFAGNASLLKSVQEMTQVVERNSITLAELSWQARSVSQAMAQLAGNGGQAADASQLLARNADQVSTQAGEVGDLARQALQNSSQGQQELQATIEAMRRMGAYTEEAGTSMARLQDSSRKIEHIAQLIREIADKINLLSLNAAIEAARAGEHGRGFAVVAQEVRNLAEKTFAATQEIDATVGGIMDETAHAVGSINTLLADVQSNVGQIEQVGQRLNGILDFSGVLSRQMEGITGASQASARQVQDISGFLVQIQDELARFGERIEAQQAQIVGLTELAEGFFDTLVELRFETTHSRMYRIAREAADAVQQAFEQALARGTLRRDDLFSEGYEPIPGTNPPKFRSRFDAFTDLALPPIQEAVLEGHPAIVFAIATQKTGYVPTHNNKFAKPPTGRYDVDLVHSRSKRIFNDRTGLRCGAHGKKMLLQTYKRDTGEIMHDLSVPIRVDGVHWGGFRMGYRAD